MNIKVGDYFDIYQDGQPTKRVIATIDSYTALHNGRNYCQAITFEDGNAYSIDVDNEIEKVLGNIYDRI
jgi:hypothetical protein